MLVSEPKSILKPSAHKIYRTLRLSNYTDWREWITSTNFFRHLWATVTKGNETDQILSHKLFQSVEQKYTSE